MEARKNPEYLRATARAVAEFRDALEAFLGLHVVNEDLARGIAPAVLPRNGVDQAEIAKVRAKVARAAGRAIDAVPLTNSYMLVQGAGQIDPIAAWQTITKPKPLLEADDVLGVCEQALGRLEAMIEKAEAEAPPTVGAEAMHPLVWGAAARLWRDGHYRESVTAAADALVAQLKVMTKRNDVAETALWQETFSNQEPVPGKPRLRWPGHSSDRDVSTMNAGLRQFAPGVQMTIRNPSAHGTVDLDKQAALERLAVLSLLARFIDKCELVEASSEVDSIVT